MMLQRWNDDKDALSGHAVIVSINHTMQPVITGSCYHVFFTFFVSCVISGKCLSG